MTLIELQRALRQLRCSRMAAGLEGRLLQAQAETLVPIEFLSFRRAARGIVFVWPFKVSRRGSR